MNGLPEGLQVFWHENGQKKEEGIFKDGLKEGKWTHWDESGQMQKEELYEDGVAEGQAPSFYVQEKKRMERSLQDWDQAFGTLKKDDK